MSFVHLSNSREEFAQLHVLSTNILSTDGVTRERLLQYRVEDGGKSNSQYAATVLNGYLAVR